MVYIQQMSRLSDAYLRRKRIKMIVGWALWFATLALLVGGILCCAPWCGYAQTAELVPVTAAKAADASKAGTRLYGGNNCYHFSQAAAVVSSTDSAIAAKEAANSKLDEKDRKPLIIKTDTDQWPYITYFKIERDCRMTNETFGGLIETKATAQLRIYPDGKLADYVDCRAGDIVEVVPINFNTVPNDGGPRPEILCIIPCR